jgi:hypothetical protein
MKFINCTHHVLNIIANDGEVITVPPSGQVARVSTVRKQVMSIGNIPVFSVEFGKVENLPEPEPETVFVVSALVAQRVPEREDVFSPGELVRDESGQPIGCKGLSK